MKRKRQHPAWTSRVHDPEHDAIYVMVETPKGSRNKFKYEPKLETFILNDVLPAGATFPYDFGFIPGTRADDGDPIDVLLLMDEPAFPGTLVPSRLLGVIEAEQTEDGKTIRNDRLVAVAVKAHDNRDLKTLKDLSGHLVKELEHFFQSYNEMKRRAWKCLGTRGPKQATALLAKARAKGK